MSGRPAPVRSLPENYRQALHLVLTRPDTLAWLNVLSLALIVPFLLLMAGWVALVDALRGQFAGAENWPAPVFWLGVLAVFPLHEWLHGLMIRRAGHTPRYGAKYIEFTRRVRIPFLLYATADGAYFRRHEFVLVALAPVVVITLAGMALIVLLPDRFGFYIALAVILNGAGAIGDLWMTVVVLRWPPSALVRDEADSIRVFVADS